MRGRIYRLSGGGKFYIGSTILTLEERLQEHKRFSNKTRSRQIPIYAHFTNINWNATIELIREFDVETKRDLLKIEREELDKIRNDPNSLNKNRPYITPMELKEQVRMNAIKWQQENKEHSRQRLQKWREENPEKVKLQRERQKAKGIKYVRDPDIEQERLRKWRKNNPEKYAEQKKRNYEALKEKRRLAKNVVE